ncbi:MAG: two pore domain potassium channel family protein [Xanthomonadales bacterium]|nr:two pore domain potassium channel family protein [Gammaproteobacteria bacterium]NND56383.1 two pore domain potassium channel family protein [Xanthomonadales bacterium]NNK50440.1 two pore domain potassium channel family protein [Xanthomonadales bacterium]
MNGPIKKNHFIWLTLALIGLMFTSAFSNELSANLTIEIVEYISVALLFLSLLSLRGSPLWSRVFVVIIGVLLIVVILRDTMTVRYSEFAYLGLLLVFYISAAWTVGRQVLLTGEVDLNIVVGSVALYLLIGLTWSIFYIILLQFSPGALAGIGSGPWDDNMTLTTYFSFVTLTTLGYGDITPVSPIARTLVILEAITGMFYLAVIVASLVGAIKAKKYG